MKTYSDLQAIDTDLVIQLDLELKGQPRGHVGINNRVQPLDTQIQVRMPLLDPLKIDIVLSDKDYNNPVETAIIIKRLSVDNIDIMGQYDYLAEYINDHGFKNPTNYLGFNGKWTLTIDRPFYHWLHLHSGQGWLLG
jgi:hypothetical protein